MGSFVIKGKVAIITGGASGMGFQFALELLKNEAKGVVLADVSSELGQKALEEVEKRFGKDKAIFIKTDIADYDQFEDVFKRTISIYQNVDILINNAAIMDDSVWEREIGVNVNGTINGMLLGLENYIKNHKSGDEGLILNISSIAGISPLAFLPIYAATKFAVYGLTLSWGSPPHYERTKVRVVGVCPGATVTPLLSNLQSRTLRSDYEELIALCDDLPYQLPEQIAPHVRTVIEKAPSGTMWVAEGGQAPYQFELPSRFTQSKTNLP